MRKIGEKQPGEMAVFGKAKELIDHTLTLTDNNNRFPKKVRFTFVNRMQDRSIQIFEGLLEANELDLSKPLEKEKRLSLQRQVMTNCKLLLFMIELSFKKQYINSNSCEYWSKLTFDVLYMTAAWHKNDKQR